MAAMTSRFNIRCVIQYYSDQWGVPEKYVRFFTSEYVKTTRDKI